MHVEDPNTLPDDGPLDAPIAMIDDADAGALAAVQGALSGDAPPAATDGADADAGEAAPITQPDAPAAKEPSDTTPAEADPAAAKPDDAAELAAAKPEDAPATKPSDEFGELPKDVKAETRERFDRMKTRFDEVSTRVAAVEAERDEAKSYAEQWVQTVQSTGADAEQFGTTLQFLRDVNSNTPEGLERAYAAALGQVEVLAQALGKSLPGVVDPLAAHPDLQAAVDNGDITPEYALQLAQAKAQATLRQAADTVTQQRSSADAEQRADQAALREVAAFGEQLRASDPLAAQKIAAVKPLIDDVIADLPREKWLPKIKALIANVQIAPPQVEPPPTVQTTLRPTATPAAGGMAKEPGNVLEAVRMALQQK